VLSKGGLVCEAEPAQSAVCPGVKGLSSRAGFEVCINLETRLVLTRTTLLSRTHRTTAAFFVGPRVASMSVDLIERHGSKMRHALRKVGFHSDLKFLMILLQWADAIQPDPLLESRKSAGCTFLSCFESSTSSRMIKCVMRCLCCDNLIPQRRCL
jgi:hypothetical protein